MLQSVQSSVLFDATAISSCSCDEEELLLSSPRSELSDSVRFVAFSTLLLGAGAKACFVSVPHHSVLHRHAGERKTHFMVWTTQLVFVLVSLRQTALRMV